MLSQLASLSALAEQTANAFPDLDDPADLEGDEPGDATVLRSGPSRADQGEDESGGRRTDRDGGERPRPYAEAGGRGQERRSPRRSGGGKAVPQPEPEVDGDATVLISSNDVPAGTAAPVSSQKRTTGSN